MRAIALLLRVVSLGKMDTFQSSFVTTIGTTVYTPSAWESYAEESRISILRHERVHMRQERRMGALRYKAYYLLWFFPIGFAYGRMKLEMEAYAESMRCRVEYAGIESVLNSSYRERMIQHFVGPNYLWAWPFRRRIEDWYDAEVAALASVDLSGK